MPQFFNVLMGDMSLVGPRPERPLFVEKFKEEIPRYMIKHQVRPGITGWAQVNGRDTVDMYDKVYYDREYVQNVGLKFDLKVLWKSVLVVLGRHGVVDGKVDPKFRQESIVLLRESKMASTDKGSGNLEQELQTVRV